MPFYEFYVNEKIFEKEMEFFYLVSASNVDEAEIIFKDYKPDAEVVRKELSIVVDVIKKNKI